MTRYKSHSEEAIKEAYDKGQEVWQLDTGNDGEDDMLIGCREEVEADVLSHHDLDELPAGWTLTKVDWL